MERPFILLVEGVDLTGKTTAIEQVTDRHDAEVVKFNAPEVYPFDEYREALALADRRAQKGKSTIIDRMHWSNQAYDPEYRPGDSSTLLSPDAFEVIERTCLTLGVTVILKTRPVDEIAAAWNTDEDEHHLLNGPAAAELAKDRVGSLTRLDQSFSRTYANSPLRKFKVPFGEWITFEVTEAQKERGTALRHIQKRRGW